jgi:hypothetical protein
VLSEDSPLSGVDQDSTSSFPCGALGNRKTGRDSPTEQETRSKKAMAYATGVSVEAVLLRGCKETARRQWAARWLVGHCFLRTANCNLDQHQTKANPPIAPRPPHSHVAHSVIARPAVLLKCNGQSALIPTLGDEELGQGHPHTYRSITLFPRPPGLESKPTDRCI